MSAECVDGRVQGMIQGLNDAIDTVNSIEGVKEAAAAAAERAEAVIAAELNELYVKKKRFVIALEPVYKAREEARAALATAQTDDQQCRLAAEQMEMAQEALAQLPPSSSRFVLIQQQAHALRYWEQTRQHAALASTPAIVAAPAAFLVACRSLGPEAFLRRTWVASRSSKKDGADDEAARAALEVERHLCDAHAVATRRLADARRAARRSKELAEAATRKLGRVGAAVQKQRGGFEVYLREAHGYEEQRMGFEQVRHQLDERIAALEQEKAAAADRVGCAMDDLEALSNELHAAQESTQPDGTSEEEQAEEESGPAE